MRVLIVDDNKTNLMVFQHLVSQLQECESTTFTNPVEALDWCGESGPDLVLVDYMMPEVDGLEFISRFREMKGMSEVPTVMVTTNDLKEVRYEALKRGATDFLSKPVDPTEFIARLTNLMALRRNQLALEDRASWLSDEVAKATADIVERENEVIYRLSRAAEYRDPETGAHIMRMAHYSRIIAEGVGIEGDRLDLIFRAAPMHDVGKVGIPDDILLKPGKLTADEFEVMKEHTNIGYEILRDSPSQLMGMAAEIAVAHHEKFGGGGYPRGVKGEAIPLVGRVCAVADVFDALTSERPYKEPWDVDRATDFIRDQSGSQFDPRCVEVFFENMDRVLEIKKRYQD